MTDNGFLGNLADALGGIAQAREWGLIILLVIVLLLMLRSMLSTVTRSMHERDRVSGEREERLIRVLIGFGDSLPKLASAIDGLRTWLGERFSDVNDDLDEIKATHGELARKVDDHEERISDLEENVTGRADKDEAR